MIKNNQKFFQMSFYLCDILCALFSFVAAYIIKFYILESNKVIAHIQLIEYVPVMIFTLFLNFVVYSNVRLYMPKRERKFIHELMDIVRANCITVFILLSALYIVKAIDFSRTVLFLYWVINICVSGIFRYTLRRTLRYYRKKGYNHRYILLIGTENTASKFAYKIYENPQFGYEFFACLSETLTTEEKFGKMKVYGGYNKLEKVLAMRVVDEVVIAVDLDEYYRIGKFINLCEKYGTKVKIVPAYQEYIPATPVLENFGNVSLLTLRRIPLNNIFNAAIKRAMDIIISLVCILLASPLMIVSAIVLKMTIDESIIFKQERIGYNCKPFKMYKFRSMRSVGECDGWTSKGDTRRTKYGAFMRKFSVDELPQFFNVLKGDMSIVGPRPELPKYVEQFMETIPRYMVKHQVKPGITGWAQVNGLRGDTSIQERINADLYYIENWSPLLDISIIIKTVFGAFYNKNE